jgi:hypothetical protein
MMFLYTYKCTWILILLSFVGCYGAPKASDRQTALESLQKTLDTWKAGGQAVDLKNVKPAIIAVDDDWERSVSLVGYQIQPNPFDDGVNLHYTVTLTLKNAQGREVKKEQVYIVGTNPVITVFRKS